MRKSLVETKSVSRLLRNGSVKLIDVKKGQN